MCNGAFRWTSFKRDVFKRDFQLVVHAYALSTLAEAEKLLYVLTLSQKDPPTVPKRGLSRELAV